MTQHDADDTGLDTALGEVIRDYGPVLNIVSRPPGACPQCRVPGPTAVHARVLTWLRCTHAVALPPLPGPRAPGARRAPPGMSHPS